METSEKVPIFARLNVKGGIPSPLHNPPMHVEVFPHSFVYSLKGGHRAALLFLLNDSLFSINCSLFTVYGSLFTFPGPA